MLQLYDARPCTLSVSGSHRVLEPCKDSHWFIEGLSTLHWCDARSNLGGKYGKLVQRGAKNDKYRHGATRYGNWAAQTGNFSSKHKSDLVMPRWNVEIYFQAIPSTCALRVETMVSRENNGNLNTLTLSLSIALYCRTATRRFESPTASTLGPVNAVNGLQQHKQINCNLPDLPTHHSPFKKDFGFCIAFTGSYQNLSSS